jgi:pilus assembly protein CpaF
MVLMAGMDLPSRAIREQMASAFHLLIHTARFGDGTRKVAKVAEITGMEGDIITMQDIAVFRQTGVSPDGQVLGQHAFTGIRPRFYERFKTMGIDMPLEIFLR